MKIKPGMKLFFKQVPNNLRCQHIELHGVTVKAISKKYDPWIMFEETGSIAYKHVLFHHPMTHTKLGKILYK